MYRDHVDDKEDGVGSHSRFKNIVLAKVLTRFPWLAKKFIDAYHPWESEDIPWAPVSKPLSQSTLALVTTAGVHQKNQKPFNMKDPHGDPTLRRIDGNLSIEDLMITHDYYDHSDADRDMNVVFPLDRLREMVAGGRIGGLADTHYGFMGHIDGPHIVSLISRSAPEVVENLRRDRVDAVLLTPG